MEKYLLLKSQKNLIFEAIVDAGFNPSDFKWSEKDSEHFRRVISVLSYSSSEYYFTFDYDFSTTFSPGETLLIDRYSENSWEQQWQTFNNWLEYLRREIESPDLWTAIAQESQLLNTFNSEDDNTLFNKEEKQYIISGINEIRRYLLEVHKMDSEIIEPRLRYLEESAQRLGRKDWKLILISIFITIINNAATNPMSVHEIFGFVSSVLNQILTNHSLIK